MYYYPGNDEDKANFHIWDKRFIKIEVTESEWEALRMLDRFEYNIRHQLYRHNELISKDDEVVHIGCVELLETDKLLRIWIRDEEQNF